MLSLYQNSVFLKNMWLFLPMVNTGIACSYSLAGFETSYYILILRMKSLSYFTSGESTKRRTETKVLWEQSLVVLKFMLMRFPYRNLYSMINI